MKVLILSPTPTHPPIAGNRARILMLAQSLMDAGHAVHFALVPLEEGDVPAMRQFFGERLEILAYRPPAAISGLCARVKRRLWRTLSSERAYVWDVDDWYDPALSNALTALQAEHGFDAVFVEYVFLSRALGVFPSHVIKVLDTHDRFADRHLQYLRAGKQPEWFSTSVDGERKGLLRADVVIAIQEKEAQEFQQLLGPQASVVTIGHLLDMCKLVTPIEEPRAVFVASGNSINVDAANYFIDSVLPLIRADRPDFELLLAGNICEHVADHAGVVKLGRVENVSDAYSKGALAINPVRMGTGLNIKTMECLAMGVPLVSTESGSRGLENLRGSAFACVPNDSPEEMAASVLSFLRSPAIGRAFAESARKAAFEWNSVQTAGLTKILEPRPQ